MTAGSLAPPLRRPLRRDLRVALPALLLGLLGFGLLFHAEAVAAVRVWIESTAYNHGFFILPIACWLAWDRRRAAGGLTLAPTPWPALAVLPLGLAWFAAERLGIMEGRQLAALGMLLLLLAALLGWRLTRVFAGPLAYLVFLVPFGAFVTPALQVFTARFVDAGLEFLDIPHVVTDFTIEIPAGTFFVAEACAGLRFLIAAIAFGALYALLVYRSPWRRLAFLAASVVVPIIANGLRALGTVVLGQILGSAQAAAADHVIYGWGFFSAILLLLIAAGLPFREDTAPRPAPPATRMAVLRPAAPWIAAAAVTLLAALGPAAAALLDRGGTAPALRLPGFAATPECLSLGDPPGAVQHFSCGGMPLTASLLALPAGSSPAALQAALLDVTGERGAEDVVTSQLAVPGVQPRAWRLVRRDDPAAPGLAHMIATAAFVDGAPASGGLAGRLRLARDGLTGDGGPAVLVAVALTSSPPARTATDAAPRALLRGFLAAQASLLEAAARASAPR